MDWQILITPVAGAVIGYWTNWIAIKMLFRPHRELRLFGKKIPLTPGLIPKEKTRITKKIGESFATSVLTKDTLTAAVSSSSVTDKLSELLDTHTALLTSGKYNEKIDELCGLFADKLVSALGDDTSPLSCALASLADKIHGYSFFDKLLATLRQNGTPLAEYIPDGLPEKMMQWLTDKTPDFVALLRDLPTCYPDIDEALGRMVRKIAEDNFGSFMGIFIKFDQLYDKFKASIFNWLEDPGNAQFAAYKISSFAANLLKQPVSDLVAKVPEDTLNDISNKLADKAKSLSPVTLLFKFVPDPRTLIKSLMKGAAFSLVNRLSGEQGEGHIQKIRDQIISALRYVAVKGGGFIVSSLKFDEIIESKMNESSVEDTEKMVLSIVSKELRLITAMGGVLGFFVGFIPVILTMVTR